jgi:CrcB protein
VKQIFVIAVGGALGAVCRFLVSEFVQKRSTNDFPFGTLAVNVSGCLIIGFLLQLGHQSDWFSPTMRALLVTGFLGAMTTFSTFGHDTIQCAESGLTIAALNVASNVVLGIGAVLLGITIARVFGAA